MAESKHVLTEAMEKVIEVLGGKPSDWYVQNDKRDPYYVVSSYANIRDAEWIRDQWDERGMPKPNYPRGNHYALIGAPMPTDPAFKRRSTDKLDKDGSTIDYREAKWDSRYAVYDNTDWHAHFSETAMKIAPWVGTIPFGQVFENRNRDGIKRIVVPQAAPQPWIDQFGADDAVTDMRGIAFPTAEELLPQAGILRFKGRADDSTDDFEGSPYAPQPFQIAIVGEKTSLFPLLAPIAKQYDAHLFLASGDLTNPLVYDIARVGGELDARPMIILYFSDSDPAGNHMPVVLSYKLSALRELWFPELSFQIHRVGLLPSQVKAYKVRAEEDPDWHELTESPIKEGESRADKWFEETGTYQTEIDSLITFHPEELQAMAHEKIGHFYDPTLAQRVIDTHRVWAARQLGRAEELDDKAEEREAAAAEIAVLEAEIQQRVDRIEELADEAKIDLSEFELEDPPDFPEADLDWDEMPEPLVDSDWSFPLQVQMLHEAMKYKR